VVTTYAQLHLALRIRHYTQVYLRILPDSHNKQLLLKYNANMLYSQIDRAWLADFTLRRPRFDVKPVHVGFVADKEEPGQISLRGNRISSVMIYISKIRLQAFMANKRTVILSDDGPHLTRVKSQRLGNFLCPIIWVHPCDGEKASPWDVLTSCCYFFLLVRQPPVGQGLLVHEVSRSHSTTHHSR